MLHLPQHNHSFLHMFETMLCELAVAISYPTSIIDGYLPTPTAETLSCYHLYLHYYPWLVCFPWRQQKHMSHVLSAVKVVKMTPAAPATSNVAVLATQYRHQGVTRRARP